jgi:hypothetical protein
LLCEIINVFPAFWEANREILHVFSLVLGLLWYNGTGREVPIRSKGMSNKRVKAPVPPSMEMPPAPPAPGTPAAPPPLLPRVGELVYFYVDGYMVAHGEMAYIPNPGDIVSVDGIEYQVMNRMWMMTSDPAFIEWVSVNLVMTSIDIAQAERERLDP